MNKEKIEKWLIENSETIACTALVVAGGIIGASIVGGILTLKINTQANMLASICGNRGSNVKIGYSVDGAAVNMDRMVQDFHVKHPEVKDIYRMVIIH